MNFATAEGVPPRRIDGRKPIRKHQMVPLCPGEGPDGGSPRKNFNIFYSVETGMNKEFTTEP